MAPSCSAAKTLIPPSDPAQTITYWKSYVIDADQDPLVAESHAVFAVLLRAWDSARLAPNLYVVDSSSGPWAASLADGSILLTRSALDTIMGFGPKRGEHLLAFVLAHELAHQRSDDLWHLRFFRLMGNRNPEMRKKIARQLHVSAQMLDDIAQKEAQADHDGLLMMASVGYDPYQILDEKDFFTAWIENIWQNACSADGENRAIARACAEAHDRALRTRVQLATVATQAMLYELGVQAFVAGSYQKARRYFTAYGRSYTNRAVLYAVGLTHFSEALTIQKRLIQQHAFDIPAFYYPLLLDASPLASPGFRGDEARKRSALESFFEQQQRILRAKIEQSIEHFEKAVRLEPNHPKSYLMLACSYLLSGNTFMVRGIVQGKYIPKFGPDGASDLILAMTLAHEGKHAKAQETFQQLIDDLKNEAAPASIPKDLLLYAAYHNYAALAEHLGQATMADRLWKELAQHAKSSGNGLLFRISVSRLEITSPVAGLAPQASNIAGLRIGDRMTSQSPHRSNDLWIEGEQYRVLRFDSGSRFVVGPDARITSAWQDSGQSSLYDSVSIGDAADRPIKVMGIPNRRLHLMSGEYLAYDKYGVALHIDNRKVVGWFLYNVD
jgi:tetratricopeptide (TPR) repeat protein